MYDELYTAWKAEIESRELEKLPPEFYCRAAEYMKKLREEGRMLDKKTLKTNLLRKEMHNAKHVIHELIQTRYRKIVSKTAKGEEISQELLTPEERIIYSKISPFSESVQNLALEIVRGQTPKIKMETEHRRVTLRFLKDVPAIIGADMKTYGPFKIEDVGVLPTENTRILIKQGLAEKVETD
jgi:DNA replication initiation complex subunit (GINS family)